MASSHNYHRPHRLLLETLPSSTTSPTTTAPPTTSSNGSRTRGGGGSYNTNEANFDTNMVIILAALLCALICALGLNSIVRCALRCSRRFSFEMAEETAARLAATGLKKSALRQIPVVVYGSEGENSNSGMHIIATDCAICLGEFMDGEKVRVLPKCSHGFHVRCIDTWLGSHSSCPTCRQSLIEQQQPSTVDTSVAIAEANIIVQNDGTRNDHHVSMPPDEVG